MALHEPLDMEAEGLDLVGLERGRGSNDGNRAGLAHCLEALTELGKVLGGCCQHLIAALLAHVVAQWQRPTPPQPRLDRQVGRSARSESRAERRNARPADALAHLHRDQSSHA